MPKCRTHQFQAAFGVGEPDRTLIAQRLLERGEVLLQRLLRCAFEARRLLTGRVADHLVHVGEQVVRE